MAAPSPVTTAVGFSAGAISAVCAGVTAAADAGSIPRRRVKVNAAANIRWISFIEYLPLPPSAA